MLITGYEKPLNKPWNTWFSESVVILHHTYVTWSVLGCVHSMIPMLWWHPQEKNHSKLHFQQKNKLGSSSFAERNCLRCACSRNNNIQRINILGTRWVTSWAILISEELCSKHTVLIMIGKELLIRNFVQSIILRKCLTGNRLPVHFNCCDINITSLQFLQDNILTQTSSTLSDPKWVNEFCGIHVIENFRANKVVDHFLGWFSFLAFLFKLILLQTDLFLTWKTSLRNCFPWKAI